MKHYFFFIVKYIEINYILIQGMCNMSFSNILAEQDQTVITECTYKYNIDFSWLKEKVKTLKRRENLGRA